MQIYHPSLQTIEQQTRELEHAQCRHCQQTRQLISHGFIRKKRVGGQSEVVGKRVFCSNRRHRTGCGRTMQLYVDSTVRYLHYAGEYVVAFVISLMAGMSIPRAYSHATGATMSRHGYRWLHRLCMQLSCYRSLPHRPPLAKDGTATSDNRPSPLSPLMSTFTMLLQRFKQPLCAAYQSQLQQSFLP